MMARISIYGSNLARPPAPHPRADELKEALTKAIEMSDGPEASAAIERVRQIALNLGQDEESKSTGAALALCLDYVKQHFNIR